MKLHSKLGGGKKLGELLKRALAAVAAMTPAEREAMYQEQRLSFARGQVALIASDKKYRGGS